MGITRSIALFYLAFMALVTIPPLAQAQSDLAYIESADIIIKRMEKANYRFALETQRLLHPERYGGRIVNPVNYLELYSTTPQYDPLGEETKETLYKHAYAYSQAEEDADRAAALSGFQTVLEAHMASLEAVMAAIPLAEETPALYDVKTLRRVRAFLANRLMSSGNGITLRRAYRAYTSMEETYLFVEKNVKLIGTEPLTASGVAYNIHHVRHIRTGEESTIYVDVTPAYRKHRRAEMLERALIREGKPNPKFDYIQID